MSEYERRRPTVEELAKLSLETLDAQKAFFKTKYQTPERSLALNHSLKLEKQLRETAARALQPRTLFDSIIPLNPPGNEQ
jgi:hypothetical protein